MIIVLFHVFYLLGEFVYRNFRCRQRKPINVNVELDGELPDFSMRAASRDSDNKEKINVKFSPPAFMQRYTAVRDVLMSARYQGKLRKVVDFGCSELGFLTYLKNMTDLEEILCVDVDRSTLEVHKEKIVPLHVDYLHQRRSPLSIRIFEGSVTHEDRELENCDAVICIELIEHVYPDTLTDFPFNVFGYIEPKVAIVTTPNADFNVLFPNFSGFRHYDHKFEWSRVQFEDWANNIVLRYPRYEVSFQGIASGPPGTEHLGCCTQMAIFHRREERSNEKVYGREGLFKLVASQEYPFYCDNRSDEEKILDEAVYYIRHLASHNMNDLDMSEEIPMEMLMQSMKNVHITQESLRNMLVEAGWSVEDREGGSVVLIPPLSTFSDYSANDDFLDNDYMQREDDWDMEAGPPSSHFDALIGRETNCFTDMSDEEDWGDEPVFVARNDSPTVENRSASDIEGRDYVNAEHYLRAPWSAEDEGHENSVYCLNSALDGTMVDGANVNDESAYNSISVESNPINPSLQINSNCSSQSFQSTSIILPDVLAFPENSASNYESSFDRATAPRVDAAINSDYAASSNVRPGSVPRRSLVETCRMLSSIDNTPCVKTKDTKEQIVERSCIARNSSPRLLFPSSVLESMPGNDSCTRSNNEYPCTNQSIVLDDSTSGETIDVTAENPKRQSPIFANNPLEGSALGEYPSVCSMYLEPSFEGSKGFSEPDDMDNLSCDESLENYVGESITRSSEQVFKKARMDDSLSVSNYSVTTAPRYASSPVALVKPRQVQNQDYPRTFVDSDGTNKGKIRHDEHSIDATFSPSAITSDSASCENLLGSTSQSSLPSNVSVSAASDISGSTLGKWYQEEANPMYQSGPVMLRGGNDAADKPNQEVTSDSDIALSDDCTQEENRAMRLGAKSHRETCYAREDLAIESLEEKGQDEEVIRPQNLAKDQIIDRRIQDAPKTRKQVERFEETDGTEARNLLNEETGFFNTSDLNNESWAEELASDIVEPVPHKDDLSFTPKQVELVDQSLLDTTKKLEESSKRITENIEETTMKLKSIFEATKEVAAIIPRAADPSKIKDAHLTSELVTSVNSDVVRSNDASDVSLEINELRDSQGAAIPRSSKCFADGTKNEANTEEKISAPRQLSAVPIGTSQPKISDSTKDSIESAERKPPVSPENNLDTPPNSCSPEIMDSGYPNSASAQDMSPEYDLSSIANDRISDSESPSIAEVPRPGFVELIEMENGDLANNNRDGEGNNVIAVEDNDIEDLQPFIDVLENDMENENDIYVLQNGFPVWLLRILQMANPLDIEGIDLNQRVLPLPGEQAGGDAPNVNVDQNDEGFDSNSSDGDTDIDDDDDDEDPTGTSSENTEDGSVENLENDWRGGGDP